MNAIYAIAAGLATLGAFFLCVTLLALSRRVGEIERKLRRAAGEGDTGPCERIRAEDATTPLLQVRLCLQNASRVDTDSDSNRQLRRLLRDPQVLDALEAALAAGEGDT